MPALSKLLEAKAKRIRETVCACLCLLPVRRIVLFRTLTIDNNYREREREREREISVNLIELDAAALEFVCLFQHNAERMCTEREK